MSVTYGNRWNDQPRHTWRPGNDYHRRVVRWRMAWAWYIALYYPQFGMVTPGGEC